MSLPQILKCEIVYLVETLFLRRTGLPGFKSSKIKMLGKKKQQNKTWDNNTDPSSSRSNTRQEEELLGGRCCWQL
jgi:hypothetical protein